MKRSVWVFALWSVLTLGCSTIPTAVQKKALPEMPFPVLIQQANQYIGETLILGGYVLDIQNLKNEMRLVVIQAPLDADLKPKARNLSEGLIILKFKAALNPETYPKESKITVAGELLGSSATKTIPSPYPYVELRLSHIHRWPD